MQSEVITQRPNHVSNQAPKGGLKRWLYALVPLAILLVLILWRFRAKQQDAAQQADSRAARKNAPAAVTAVPAQVRDVVQNFAAVGNVESPFNVKIAAKVTGRIDFLQLREGDKVQVGQVLARVDPTQLEAAVRQQQSMVADAQFKLAQAQLGQGANSVNITTQINQQAAAVASSQADYNQTKGNYDAQVAAAQAAVTDATGRVRNAAAGIASAQADYNQVKSNYTAQLAAAQEAVNAAQGVVKNAKAAVTSAQADYNQTKGNYAAQVESAQAGVTDVQGRIGSSNAAITNANATIKSAQANLANARAKYNRTYALYKQGFVAPQDVDDAKTEVSVQQGNLDVAQAQLTTAQAGLQSTTAQKQSAQNQVGITSTSGQANIEVAQAKVGQAQAALDSAAAQEAATAQQANIGKITLQAGIEDARSKVVAAQSVLASNKAQQNSAQQQANITIVKGKADIEAAREKVVQAQAALAYARSNTPQRSAYQQSLDALRSEVTAAQASLRGAESQLSDTILKSPINGFVTARYLDPGAVVTAGQPMLAVEAVRQVWVTVPVPEDVSRKVHFGQTAVVTLDALPGQTFMSKVVEINPSADPQSRQFTIRTVIDNPKNQLKPGMFAHVNMEVERDRGAVVVPREAVQQDKTGTYVMVVGPDNTAQRRDVTTGASDTVGISIKTGLKPGEKVITLSATTLREGQPVRTGSGKGGKGGKGSTGDGAGAAGGEAQPGAASGDNTAGSGAGSGGLDSNKAAHSETTTGSMNAGGAPGAGQSGGTGGTTAAGGNGAATGSSVQHSGVGAAGQTSAAAP